MMNNIITVDPKTIETTTIQSVVESMLEDVTVLSQPTEVAEYIIDSDIESPLSDQTLEHGDELEAMPLETISADILSAEPITLNPMEDTPMTVEPLNAATGTNPNQEEEQTMTVEPLNAATGTNNPYAAEDNPMTEAVTIDTPIEEQTLSQDDTSLPQQSGEPVLTTDSAIEHLLPDETQDRDEPLREALLDYMGGQMPMMSRSTPQSAPPKSPKGGKPSDTGGCIVTHLTDPSKIILNPREWLWNNKFPYGCLSLIVGLLKLGKSMFAIYMAATVSLGRLWCDGSVCEQGSVLFFAGEDDHDEYTRRLIANGADLTKIRFLNGATLLPVGSDEVKEIDITLARLDVLEDAIERTEKETGLPVGTVIIDPISNFWGKVNENSNAAVRSVLHPLQQFFHGRKIAPILIQHLRKTSGSQAQQRIMGSTAIGGTARSIWGVFTDPNDIAMKESEKMRYLVPYPSNVCIDPVGISFRIALPDGKIDVVDTEVERSADDFELAWKQASKSGASPEKLDDAKEWLLDFLKDGRKPAGTEGCSVPGTVYGEAKAAGHSGRTTRRAYEDLKIPYTKVKGRSYWELPSDQNVPLLLPAPDPVLLPFPVQSAPPLCPTGFGQADGSSTTEPLDIACPPDQITVVQAEVGQANELGMPMESTPLSQVVDRASELPSDDGNTSKNDDSVLGDAGSVFTPPPVIKMESHSELAADHVSILAVPFRNPRGGGAYKELKYSAAEFRGKVISACDIKELYLETIRELWAENRICVIAAIGRMNGGQLISKSPGKKSVPLDGGYYLNTSMWHCYFLQCLRSLLTEMNLASELFVRYAV